MKYQIIISDQAKAQLFDIRSFLQRNVSPAYAIRTIKEIQALINSLKEMPERYAYARNIVLKRQGFRCAVCKKYLIFYKVFPDSKTIRIYAVTDGTRDYLSLVM